MKVTQKRGMKEKLSSSKKINIIIVMMKRSMIQMMKNQI